MNAGLDHDKITGLTYGASLPLNIALTPNYEVRPQPVPLGIQLPGPAANRTAGGVYVPSRA